MCSNSLRSDQLENAVGLLKEELRRLNSLILRCADTHRVAAGELLAVDRMAFSQAITEAIQGHPNITLQSGEAKALPEEGQVIWPPALSLPTIWPKTSPGGSLPGDICISTMPLPPW